MSHYPNCEKCGLNNFMVVDTDGNWRCLRCKPLKKPRRKIGQHKYVGVKCKYPGCTFQARAKGYCKTHYHSVIAKKSLGKNQGGK